MLFLQNQLNQHKSERQTTNSAMVKLEEEVKSLRQLLSHVFATMSVNAQATGHSYVPSQSSHPLQHSQSLKEQRDYQKFVAEQQFGGGNRSSSRQLLNLSYGTINHDDTAVTFATEGDLIKPMPQQFNDIRKAEKMRYSHQQQQQNNGKHESVQTIRSSIGPADHRDEVINNTEQQHDVRMVQKEKDEVELRQELQHAIASKKHAENKVLA